VWPCIIYHALPKELKSGGKGPGEAIGAGGAGGLVEFSNFDIMILLLVLFL
jgi:hypothetical protein